MAQQITDYAAFFASARQAVEELEELKKQELQLTQTEKQMEDALKGKQKAVMDTISQTIKQRTEEISKSYDAEIGKTQDHLKKVRAKREKAKSQGVRERIAEDTSGLLKENRELKEQMKTLFRANHVPGFCRSSYYYALYFTRSVKDALTLLLTIFICFLGVPCGIYFLLPEKKTVYLIGIYLVLVLVFGGIYVAVGNRTKLKYMDVLKEGREIRRRILGNRKQIRVIAKTIRRDKNDTVYNLQKFDDEIAQLEQDLTQVKQQKKEALNTFETVTRTIISDEISENHKTELSQMEDELSRTTETLKRTRTAAKEKALYITDHFEVYAGKEYMTVEKLALLEDIVRSGEASNVSEAISVYRRRQENS